MQRLGIPTSRLLLIFVLLSASLLFLDSLRVLQPAKDALSRITLPLMQLFSGFGEGVASWGRYFQSLEQLQEENRALQALVEQLTIENVGLREAAIENEELRRLLEFKAAHPEFETIAAIVVGREPSSLFQDIVIDRGREDGLQPGMPVVTERGLVGQVVEVYANSARVQKSRATGAVQGTPQGGLVMQFIPQEVQVEMGDILLTAGLGGRFPRGLVIGQITEVRRSDVEVFQEAEVRPSVDFNRLEIVLVIVNFAPMPTGME
ncbi:MAG: rod shape-determining protein MreC [Chloroflexi bacterium]|nr:rod shape-determining protein MreC [Chloroflexota bacterium]